jgi:purine-cytosine permease-like protein
MVLSRYSFGYYGTKWIVSPWFKQAETDRARPDNQQTFLEFATNIGWSVVTGLVGAELMVALTNDKLPIIPSIIIVSASGFRLAIMIIPNLWCRFASSL